VPVATEEARDWQSTQLAGDQAEWWVEPSGFEALVFVATGPARWAAVAFAAGPLIGSTLGPVLVRRLPSNLFRWVATTFSLVSPCSSGWPGTVDQTGAVHKETRSHRRQLAEHRPMLGRLDSPFWFGRFGP
jgi:hypothetical protein